MTTMSGHSETNPYVGPRSIQQGEPLFGRSEEVRALYCELQARRIVVLHSPSGAGKSSLVQAGLIPRLREEKFDVWKPIRVNLDPAGLDGVPEATNRYLLSAMVNLEQELPEDKRRSPAQLAELDFGTYLQTRPRRRKQQGRPVVLLFDQFEEVLTVAPRAVDAKRAFFTALGRALKDERYWALFVIREDYLAAFAPYRDRIPTRLANTLRLDLLGLEGAREAALRPALEAGREFPAVDQLVRDLSTVQVQQADGSFVPEQGLHVEPVQLQVVCRRLWGAMPADAHSIDEEDIEQYARVCDSLASYYADAVEEAAGGDIVAERAIRQWVGRKLIKDGIRSQVRQGPGQSGGLDNALIERLLDSYVVRTEHHAGANWFELSHDRLVGPVQQDNEEWERAHLHPLQVQAKLWEDGRRDRALLLGADALPGAVGWARDNAAQVTQSEREFLEQSQAARAEERRRRRGQRVFMAMISVVAMVAISLGAYAWDMKAEAQQNADWARRSAWEATVNGWMAKLNGWMANYQAWKATLNAWKATLNAWNAGMSRLYAELAMVAANESDETAQREKEAAETARHQTRDARWMTYVRAFKDKDPTRAILALRSIDSNNTPGWLSNAQDVVHQPIAQGVLINHKGRLVSANFSSDGNNIVTASSDKIAREWNSDGTGKPIVKGHDGAVIAVSPDGDHIITVSGKTTRVWETNDTDNSISLVNDEDEDQTDEDHEGDVASAHFSPNGKYVVTASRNKARVWKTDTGEPLGLVSHEGVVVAVSGDGKRIATASSDNRAHVWKINGTDKPVNLEGHTNTVVSASFQYDGELIVTASLDESARLWNSRTGKFIRRLEGHEGAVLAASFSPDGTRIVTASLDRTARVWHPITGKTIHHLVGHEDAIVSVAFSKDSKSIVTASYDNTARVWRTEHLNEKKLSTKKIREFLKDSSTMCVPPQDRREYLGDTENEAREAFATCEHEYGRSGDYRDEPDDILQQAARATMVGGVVKGIYFSSNKAVIRKKSQPVLNEVLRVLTDFPTINLEIVGHTDDRGNHDYNVDLSERRADAVRAWLVDHGIAPERIETRGVGPDDPLESNDTRQGRAMNRRIEFRIPEPTTNTE